MPKQKTLTDNDPRYLINYYERFSDSVGKYLMFDVIIGANLPIDVLMYHMIKYFAKDRYRSIVDPTCGLENHLFSNIVGILRYWGMDYKPCDINPKNWACRNGYSNCVCDVFNRDTLPEGEVWVYDPPYVPHESNFKDRKDDYSMHGQTVSQIKRFYSPEVFNNFISRGAKLIIVKGSSFYYPTDSEQFYLFERDVIQPTERMKLIARIIYRYFINANVINNYRIAQSLPPNIKRVQLVSTVFMVFRVI